MSDNIRITPDGAEDEMTSDEESVHLDRVAGGTGGRRSYIVLESEYEAKDDIKALDWDRTHRSWEGDINAWTVDLDALNEVIAHFQDAGRTVTVDVKVAQVFEGTKGGRVFLPEER